MRQWISPGFAAIAAITTLGFGLAGPPAGGTGLRFEVTVGPGLLPKPTDGRLLVVLGKVDAEGEPRNSIGETGLDAPPLFGADVNGFAPGVVGVIDARSESFPIESLSKLPAGEYVAQAVFDWNPRPPHPERPGQPLQRPAPGHARPGQGRHRANGPRPPGAARPAAAGYGQRQVRQAAIEVAEPVPRPADVPAGRHRLAAGTSNRSRTASTRCVVLIGGYGSRYTAAGNFAMRRLFRGPPVVILHLDGAGPYGDPYQVNSANNGPYGDAVTQELIPFVEKKYRCVGRPEARFTTGTSTGGWVSLALQVFYPDFFNGCWSFAPDPVDFRAYELINIYEDKNAYVNHYGFERPAKRNVWGDTIYNVRHECQVENVLGRGNRWWVSGKDWCAWNAVFGPRGADGLPEAALASEDGHDRSVGDGALAEIRPAAGADAELGGAGAEVEGQAAHLRRRCGRLFSEQRRANVGRVICGEMNPPFDGRIQLRADAGPRVPPGQRMGGDYGAV